MNKKAASTSGLVIPTDIQIREIRGQRVILDSDLAAIYGVPTKSLNRAVKRNAVRFPRDFLFALSAHEFDDLRCQSGTANPASPLTSQIVISKPGRGGRRSLPYAFTEHGALQAANVLKSERAAAMSVYVIRAFVQMREQLMANTEILRRIAEMDRKLLEHDEALVILWNQLKPLLATPPPLPPKPKRRIGF